MTPFFNVQHCKAVRKHLIFVETIGVSTLGWVSKHVHADHVEPRASRREELPLAKYNHWQQKSHVGGSVTVCFKKFLDK